MKKLTTTILAAAMILSLAGCGNDTSSIANDGSEPTTSTVTADTSKTEDTSAVESTPAESDPEDTTASDSEITTSAPEEEEPPAEEYKGFQLPEPTAVTKVEYDTLRTGPEYCYYIEPTYSESSPELYNSQLGLLDADFKLIEGKKSSGGAVVDNLYIYRDGDRNKVVANKDEDIVNLGKAEITISDGIISAENSDEGIFEYYDYDGNKLDMPYCGTFIEGYACKGENGKVSIMDASGSITEYAIDYDFSASEWTYFLGGEYIVTFNMKAQLLSTYNTDGDLISAVEDLAGGHSLGRLSDGSYFYDGLLCLIDNDGNSYFNVITGEKLFDNPNHFASGKSNSYAIGAAYATYHTDSYSCYVIADSTQCSKEYESCSDFSNGVALVNDGGSVYFINEKFEKISDDICTDYSNNVSLFSDGVFTYFDDINCKFVFVTVTNVE